MQPILSCRRLLRAVALALVTLVGATSVEADMITSTWDGGGGNLLWGTANNWDPNGVPNNDGDTYDVVVSGAAITANGSFTINALTLESTASVFLGDNNGLTLSTDSTNDGTITLRNTGTVGDAVLTIAGNVTLGGSGQVVFDLEGGGGGAFINGANPGDTLTVGADQTIATLAGTSGTDRVMNVRTINNGTIEASPSAATNRFLILAGEDKVNNHLMRASDGGILRISAVEIINTLGTITAGAGGEVDLDNGATVTGGLIDGGGTVQVVQATGSTAPTLDGVTLDGVGVALGDGDTLVLQNTITNDGTLTLRNTGGVGDAVLTIDGDVTLAGSGDVLFDIDGGGGGSSIDAGPSGGSLTIGPDQTVHTVAVATGLERVLNVATTNNGTVEADTGTLGIAGPFTNHGTVRAKNGGTASFAPTAIVTNYAAATQTLTGGTWQAMADSALSFNGNPAVTTNAAGVTLSGAGSVFIPINSLASNAAGGAFRVLGGRSFTSTGGLTNAGRVEVGTGSTLSVSGTYTQTAGETTVNGLLAGTGQVDLQGGTLTGSGSVAQAVAIAMAASVAPGNSTGVLTFEEGVDLGGIYLWQLAALQDDSDGVAGSAFDQLLVTGGDVAFDGVLGLDFLNGTTPDPGEAFWQGDHAWTILDNVGSGTTTLTSALISGYAGGSGHFDLGLGGTGNDLVLRWTAVPEPASLGLLALGVMLTFVVRRRLAACG